MKLRKSRHGQFCERCKEYGPKWNPRMWCASKPAGCCASIHYGPPMHCNWPLPSSGAKAIRVSMALSVSISASGTRHVERDSLFSQRCDALCFLTQRTSSCKTPSVSHGTN